MKFLFMLVLSILHFSGNGIANDSDISLYAAPLDNNNQSYFRILGAEEVSDYLAYEIQEIEALAKSKNVLAGQYYSLINNEEQLLVLDQQVENKTKAVLAFYNLSSSKDLTLKANDTISVFDAPNDEVMGAREINAAKISFQVYQGSEKIAEIEPVILERQNHYSLIYNGKDLKVVQAKIMQ